MNSPVEPSGDVSANNPCPFLRAMVAKGAIDAHHEPLTHVSAVATTALDPPAKQRRDARIKVFLVGMIGNGVAPWTLVRNLLRGLRPDELRGGPLDKRGVGTRILDARGRVDLAELERFDSFAVDCRDTETGQVERGLRATEIRTMMDANFARAAGSRRRVDRKLMDFEWPVLLTLMAKPGSDEPYLSVAEVRTLFLESRLPARVLDRLASTQR
jgi:hypothetical protein